MLSPKNAHSEYIARINRVIDYIDHHLSDTLPLDKLAEVAHFSPWHFHRIFASATGETLADCIRRRRLEYGAGQLINQRKKPVLAIALDMGFTSSEVFSRNFRQHFGVTPSAWREGAWREWAEHQQVALSKIRHVHRKNRQAEGLVFADNPPYWTFGQLLKEDPAMSQHAMPVTIKEIPDYRVAYMRHIGPYGESSIPAFWERMMKWCETQGFTQEPRLMFGVAHDDPCITPPERCRYDACVEVDASFAPSGEIGVQIVPGGKYACAEFYSATANIGPAWTWLCGQWLPQSGYQYDSRPCFELYAPDVVRKPEPGKFQCLICIPVKPL